MVEAVADVRGEEDVDFGLVVGLGTQGVVGMLEVLFDCLTGCAHHHVVDGDVQFLREVFHLLQVNHFTSGTINNTSHLLLSQCQRIFISPNSEKIFKKLRELKRNH